jgi:hypothetical protein
LTMPTIACARPNMMGNTANFFSSAIGLQVGYAAFRSS